MFKQATVTVRVKSGEMVTVVANEQGFTAYTSSGEYASLWQGFSKSYVRTCLKTFDSKLLTAVTSISKMFEVAACGKVYSWSTNKEQ